MMEEKCFGIIPLRKENNNWLVFLVKLKSGNHWGFPKGHRESLDENFFDIAKRELREETGFFIANKLSEEPLFQEEYIISKKSHRVQKKVAYFPAIVKGEAKLQKKEILDGRWLTLKKASELLTYAQSKKVCSEAEKFLSKIKI